MDEKIDPIALHDNVLVQDADLPVVVGRSVLC